MAGGDAEARLVLRGVDENATAMLKKARAESRGLANDQKEVAKSTVESNVAFLKNADALRQTSRGLNMVGNSMETLGLLTKEQAQVMNAGVAIMNLFVGAAMGIQGIIGLINALRTSTIALTVVEALRTGLIPFIGPALVAAAIGAAAGAAVFLAASAQTSPGERRTVKESGPVYAHKGEQIGRVGQARMGGGVNVTIQAGAIDIGNFYDRRDLAKKIGKAVNG
jgi:hypothetical protein